MYKGAQIFYAAGCSGCYVQNLVGAAFWYGHWNGIPYMDGCPFFAECLQVCVFLPCRRHLALWVVARWSFVDICASAVWKKGSEDGQIAGLWERGRLQKGVLNFASMSKSWCSGDSGNG